METAEAVLSPVFDWVWRSSWQAAVLVGLVVGVQWLLGHRLSARWRYALWFLVLARLLVPFTPASALSIFNFTRISPIARIDAAKPMEAGQSRGSPVKLPASGLARMESAPEPVSETAPRSMAELSEGSVSSPKPPLQPAIPPSRAWSWKLVLVAIWLGGMGIMAVRFAWETIRFAGRMRQSAPSSNRMMAAVMQECRQAMGVRAPVAIMETEAVCVPAMFGFLRPHLLLPNSFGDRFSPEELRLIFLHELAHYKRGDLVMNWLLILVNLLHWFNPVIWIAFARLRSDRELACDELVLNLSREEETKRYGHVIIKLMEQFAEPARLTGLVGVLEDKNQMQRRIRMIAQFKKTHRWSVFALALLLALGLLTLTDAQEQSEKPNTPAQAVNPALEKPTGVATSEQPVAITVADWTFEEGVPGQSVTRVEDRSGKGHPGSIIMGTPRFVQSDTASQGKVSVYLPAGDIAGSGFSPADSPDFNFGDQFTLEATVTPGENNPGPHKRYLVGGFNPASGQGVLGLGYDGDLGVALIGPLQGPVRRDGRSHHVAAVYLRPILSLYIDGKLVGSTNLVIEGFPATGAPFRLTVGADYNGGFWFNGTIDRVRISNQALSVEKFFIAFSQNGPKSPARFDAAADFSPTKNPSGAWSYGWMPRTPLDFWNVYSRDDGQGGFRSDGQLPNMKWADGSTSQVGLNVTNAAGAWFTLSPDAMFNSYLYPLGGANITLWITNLPAGTYDFYVYAHGQPDEENGVVELKSGTINYGEESTTTAPGWNTIDWQEGQQFVLFTNVVVTGDQPVVITVLPGMGGKAVLNGMQIVKQIALPPQPSAADLLNVNFTAHQNPAFTTKVGSAAVGFGTLDFTLYTKSSTPYDVNMWTGEFPPDRDFPDSAAPHVSFNPTNQFRLGDARLKSRRITAHPGPIGQRCVVRWTAPRPGPIELAAAFEGRDVGMGATTDASVYHNGSLLFAGDVEGYDVASRITFATNLTVTAGDTIDFVVGYGSDRAFFRDTTQVDATVLVGSRDSRALAPLAMATNKPITTMEAQSVGASESRLAPVGAPLPFRTGAGAGYIIHPTGADSEGASEVRVPEKDRTVEVRSVTSGTALKSSSAQDRYDASADFWPTKNPNGAWSYGWMPRTTLDFTLYTEMRTPSDLNAWTGPFPPDPFNPDITEPLVLFNPTAEPFENNGVRLASRRLNCHPGRRGERNVVRWTAPTSSSFELVAAFEGSDLGGATTDASIYYNSSQLFAGEVEGYGEASRISFTTNLTVTAGDTIDFVVGYGANRAFFRDTTQVDATLIDQTRAAPTKQLPKRSSQPPVNASPMVPLGEYVHPETRNWGPDLSQGTHVCDGVTFTNEGAIRTAGLRAVRDGKNYPGAVLGVPINRRGTRIHLLQSAENGLEMTENAPYAHLRFHYANGETRPFDLLFGVHGRDWWQDLGDDSVPHETTDPNTKVGWELSKKELPTITVRLYHTMIENPLPNETITSADFISSLYGANVLVFAITVDGDPRPIAEVDNRSQAQPYSAPITFELQSQEGKPLPQATLAWRAVGTDFEVEFPPFPADAKGCVVIDLPRQFAGQIRYQASAGGRQDVEGKLSFAGSDLNPMGIVVRLAPGTQASRILPAQSPAPDAAQRCRAALRRIQAAKQQWALENRKDDKAVPTDADLFGPSGYLPEKPTCPSGGSYTLGTTGEGPRCFPRCSIPGHTYSANAGGEN